MLAPFNITIPTASRTDDGQGGRPYTIYHIRIQNPLVDHTSFKRFDNFREFDKEWRDVFPGPANLYKLPSSFVLNKNSDEVIEERRKGLEVYLNGLATVKAMQPLVCQFIGVVYEDIVPQGKATSDASGHAQPDMAAVANTDENKGPKKGNSEDASRRAYQDKEDFIRKNRGLIESLLPGNNLVLASAQAPSRDVNGVPAGGISGGEDAIFQRRGTVDGGLQTAVVICAYIPEQDGTVALKLGQTVQVTDKKDKQWWYGIVDGVEGYFPADFVKLNAPGAGLTNRALQPISNKPKKAMTLGNVTYHSRNTSAGVPQGLITDSQDPNDRHIPGVAPVVGLTLEETAVDADEGKGCRVVGLTADPARVAGFLIGDIVTHVNGRPLLNMDMLGDAFAGIEPRDVIPFAIIRDGKAMELSLTVGFRKKPKKFRPLKMFRKLKKTVTQKMTNYQQKFVDDRLRENRNSIGAGPAQPPARVQRSRSFSIAPDRDAQQRTPTNAGVGGGAGGGGGGGSSTSIAPQLNTSASAASLTDPAPRGGGPGGGGPAGGGRGNPPPPGGGGPGGPGGRGRGAHHQKSPSAFVQSTRPPAQQGFFRGGPPAPGGGGGPAPPAPGGGGGPSSALAAASAASAVSTGSSAPPPPAPLMSSGSSSQINKPPAPALPAKPSTKQTSAPSPVLAPTPSPSVTPPPINTRPPPAVPSSSSSPSPPAPSPSPPLSSSPAPSITVAPMPVGGERVPRGPPKSTVLAGGGGGTSAPPSGGASIGAPTPTPSVKIGPPKPATITGPPPPVGTPSLGRQGSAPLGGGGIGAPPAPTGPPVAGGGGGGGPGTPGWKPPRPDGPIPGSSSGPARPPAPAAANTPAPAPAGRGYIAPKPLAAQPWARPTSFGAPASSSASITPAPSSVGGGGGAGGSLNGAPPAAGGAGRGRGAGGPLSQQAWAKPKTFGAPSSPTAKPGVVKPLAPLPAAGGGANQNAAGRMGGGFSSSSSSSSNAAGRGVGAGVGAGAPRPFGTVGANAFPAKPATSAPKPNFGASSLNSRPTSVKPIVTPAPAPAPAPVVVEEPASDGGYKYYTLEQLKRGPLPDVEESIKEMWMTDENFLVAFGMTKYDWDVLTQGQKDELKRKVGLIK